MFEFAAPNVDVKRSLPTFKLLAERHSIQILNSIHCCAPCAANTSSPGRGRYRQNRWCFRLDATHTRQSLFCPIASCVHGARRRRRRFAARYFGSTGPPSRALALCSGDWITSRRRAKRRPGAVASGRATVRDALNRATEIEVIRLDE